MRKLTLIALAAMAACATVQAEPRYVELRCDVATNAAFAIDSEAVSGRVLEILIQGPSQAGVTANVSVVMIPFHGSNMVATVLATNETLTASQLFRPRIVPTGTSGSALSSLTVAEPVLCVGDTMRFLVTQTSAQVTTVVFKAWAKIE